MTYESSTTGFAEASAKSRQIAAAQALIAVSKLWWEKGDPIKRRWRGKRGS